MGSARNPKPTAYAIRPSMAAMQVILERSGIRLSSVQLDQMWLYHQLLRQYNPALNLTRIHNFENMILKLYVDSLLPAQMLELPSPLLDLGTGPGMPGIPLKIMRPEVSVLLAESRQNRVAFLETVCSQLQLQGVRVVGQGINPSFREPVAAVITRAVESVQETLARVQGCLQKDGLVIFMKGPRCDAEIEEACDGFSGRFELLQDRSYRIPHTEHERRLVVFRRLDEPLGAWKEEHMSGYRPHPIESEQNDSFKDLRKLTSTRGIKKQGRALVAGEKLVRETIRDFPDVCEAWISLSDSLPPPPEAPLGIAWYVPVPRLFEQLDTMGTHSPLLVVRVASMPKWDPVTGFVPGCNLLVPFQDPENVGAVIRSALALGVTRVILLSESAHPYHPKALRASGGAVLRMPILHGPSLAELPEHLAILALSPIGRDLANVAFPHSFGLLVGMEGAGLPEKWRSEAIAIPLRGGVESLNAAAATAIALYVWSRHRSHAGEEVEPGKRRQELAAE
jgi:16S rRNA (guanine(527)-N(7))-methyltransferase RsmG